MFVCSTDLRFGQCVLKKQQHSFEFWILEINVETCLVFSLSCWALMSFSLGCPLCISCRAIWLTTATRDAWLFISGSRLSNLEHIIHLLGTEDKTENGAWQVHIGFIVELKWNSLSCGAAKEPKSLGSGFLATLCDSAGTSGAINAPNVWFLLHTV